MHTLPTAMLEQRALPLHAVDEDDDMRLADQLWPVLAGLLEPSDPAAGDPRT